MRDIEDRTEQKNMQNTEESLDILDVMLENVYDTEGVPSGVNTRLKNRLECRQVMGTGRFSFWWLPATVATVISVSVGIILCLLYVVINITGAHFWMPNLLQLVSEAWLKTHLLAITMEAAVSWLITLIGVWKGNLVGSARLM